MPKRRSWRHLEAGRAEAARPSPADPNKVIAENPRLQALMKQRQKIEQRMAELTGTQPSGAHAAQDTARDNARFPITSLGERRAADRQWADARAVAAQKRQAERAAGNRHPGSDWNQQRDGQLAGALGQALARRDDAAATDERLDKRVSDAREKAKQAKAVEAALSGDDSQLMAMAEEKAASAQNSSDIDGFNRPAAGGDDMFNRPAPAVDDSAAMDVSNADFGAERDLMRDQQSLRRPPGNDDHRPGNRDKPDALLDKALVSRAEKAMAKAGAIKREKEKAEAKWIAARESQTGSKAMVDDFQRRTRNILAVEVGSLEDFISRSDKHRLAALNRLREKRQQDQQDEERRKRALENKKRKEQENA